MNVQKQWLCVFVVGVIGMGYSLSLAENWPGWRGPRGDGTSIEKNLPTQWSADKNILWKMEIPGIGHSSPIVWEDRIFIASALPDKQQRLLLCLDALSGKILWQQTVVESSLEKIHPENSYASSTPATDGQKVYLAFLDGKDIVAAAYDFTGKQVWLSRPGKFSGEHGFAASPVLYDGQIIFNCDSRESSLLLSLSCTDGRTLWKVSHPIKPLGFSTPLVRQMAGRTQLVLSGNKGVYSCNPDDGTVLWFVDGVDDEFVTTPVYHEKLQKVYITGSWPKRNLLAIDVTGSGDVTKTHVTWALPEGAPYINSPVIVDDYILGVDINGVAKCYDAGTGKIFWSQNLGKAHASSVVIEGLVYFLCDDGVVNVVKPGPEFKSIAKNEMGQSCYASPAVSNGRLYIRGKTHLFCIANPLSKPRTVSRPKNDKLPTVWVIGDSTVKNDTQGLLGWGDPIAALFDTNKINVCNRGLGGRSSRTFQTEGLWDNVLSEMKPGDFVLIQFGHNDNGPMNTGRARASIHSNGDETQEVVMESTGKKEVVHSYGWYIRNYIADAKAKGATPIILSLVTRNIWDKEGKTVVRATDDFAKWASEAAKQGGADFVDLNGIIADHYEAEGQEKVKTRYFMTDHTHTTPAGAELNAACVVEGLKKLSDCKLCDYLLPQGKK
jgi:outer membrane protein assembly factor BamB/lysophospholipase L1-like esterase